MFANFLLRYISPNVFSALFFWGMPVLLFIRYLFTNPRGVLLLVSTIYVFAFYFSDSPPYTFAELIMWFDSLDKEFKTGVATSLLTIIGFLITFHAATNSWKGEVLAKLRVEAAYDIENFFNEASRLTCELSIFAKAVIRAVEGYKLNGVTSETTFQLQQIIDQTPQYLVTRDRLSAMSVEAHRFGGRHAAIISGLPLATLMLEKSIQSLTEITRNIWFRLPNQLQEQQIASDDYVARIDLKNLQAYIETYEEKIESMHGSDGGLRGILLYAVTGFNLSMINSVKDKELLKRGVSKTLLDQER
ncbi:MAG: hypothetical protein Q7T66_04820 [Herminiimonas sp.]|uniref:hypothetical protein n=1 Tax=Herminiimonas sp. TaxID=1926289 RepID=UPI0027278D18|nr:hypothetical protein [Herminiimonas sp.]MDO9419968.1 hypothetical protein [Herminiimonas sp.]